MSQDQEIYEIRINNQQLGHQINNSNNQEEEKLGIIYSVTAKRAKMYQQNKQSTLSSDNLDLNLNGLRRSFQKSLYMDNDQQEPQQQKSTSNIKRDDSLRINLNSVMQNGHSNNNSISNPKRNQLQEPPQQIISSRRRSKQRIKSETELSSNQIPNSGQPNQGSNERISYQNLLTSSGRSSKRMPNALISQDRLTNTKKVDLSNIDPSAKPYELVEIRGNQLYLNQDLIQEIFIKYEGNIQIVSVIGLPDKGKSTFLNKFLQGQQLKKFYEREQEGQEIGTEGAVLWGVPLYNDKTNTHIFLIDVQGIDLKDIGNLKLQLFILLMSDLLLFYSDSSLKDTVTNELQFLNSIESLLKFPILDQNIKEHMPEIVIFAQESNIYSQLELFSPTNSNYDSPQLQTEIEFVHFEGDNALDKFLHYIPNTADPSDLKIKKLQKNLIKTPYHILLYFKQLLNQSFKEKYCYLKRFNLNDSASSLDQEQELSLKKKISHSRNGSYGSNNRVSSYQPLLSSNKNRNQFQNNSRQIGRNYFGLPSQTSLKKSSNTNSILQNGQARMIPSLSGFKLSKIVDEYNGPKNNVEFLQKIINLPSKYKKFKSIPINSYTFCKYINLLIDEINQGGYFDPNVMAFKAVNYEFNRISQIVLKDHEQRLHSLVQYDKIQHIQKVMQSLASIRMSVIDQFNSTVYRFASDNYYKETYTYYFKNFKNVLDYRENQVIQLFKNISFGINEQKYKTLQMIHFYETLAEQDNLIFKEFLNKFTDRVQFFCKEFLTQDSEVEGIEKVRIYELLCVEEISKQFKEFSAICQKSYLGKKEQINQNGSNKTRYEQLLQKYEVMKQKSKLLEEMQKGLEKETENLNGIEKTLNEKYLKHYNSQKTYKDNQIILQKIKEKDEKIKNLVKSKNNLLGLKTNSSILQKSSSRHGLRAENKDLNSEGLNTQHNVEQININQKSIVNKNQQDNASFRFDTLQFNWLHNLSRSVSKQLAFFHF